MFSLGRVGVSRLANAQPVVKVAAVQDNLSKKTSNYQVKSQNAKPSDEDKKNKRKL